MKFTESSVKTQMSLAEVFNSKICFCSSLVSFWLFLTRNQMKCKSVFQKMPPLLSTEKFCFSTWFWPAVVEGSAESGRILTKWGV